MQEYPAHIRQMALPGWGKKGQARLAETVVLIVGAGGLGSGLAPVLASAGVGKIILTDGDVVEESNLSRQLWYTRADVGKIKVEAAAGFLRNRYPDCKIEVRHLWFEESVFSQFDECDFVFDCTDDIPSRYSIEKFSMRYNKPWISGSLHRFQAQIALFHYAYAEGKRSANYSFFFPKEEGKLNSGNCSDNGVAPYFPALVAQLMAGEFFKAIIGYEKPLINELLLFDGLHLTLKKIAF